MAQLALAHDALDQEAELQEAELQEALDHEAELQEAELQEALDQDAEAHDALLAAYDFQELGLNVFRPSELSKVTNWLRPAFGFAVPLAARAAEALTTPTPRAPIEL